MGGAAGFNFGPIVISSINQCLT